jgi:uncharacterized membrane protein
VRGVRRGLLLLLVAAAAALALPACAGDRTSDVVDADVTLRLAKDSSLLVTEKLDFDYHGKFEGSYRDIALGFGEKVTDVQVSEGGQPYVPGGNTALGSHDAPGVFGATSIPGGVRIVWHYAANEEHKVFTVSYRVIGGVVAFDDVIQVGWKIWGSQWDFDLDHLTGRVLDQSLDPANPAYQVWAYPREVEADTTRGAGEATVEADDVHSGQYVEMRVTVPRRPGQNVSGARRQAGPGLPSIVAEEKGFDDDFNGSLKKAKRWVGHHAELLAALLAALTLLAVALMAWLTREHPVSTPKYLPEPPDDASPAVAYGLAHEGMDTTDTVLATLLDLVERGHYDAKQATTDDEKLDLALAVAKKRPAEKLEPHEQQVRDFFDELLGTETVAMSEMKDKIPEHSDTWRTRWEEMTGALDSADDGALVWDRTYNGRRILLALVAAALFAVIAVIQWNVEHNWFVTVAIGGAAVATVVLLPWTWFKRLDQKSRERSSQWAAFERWTHDFPSLKDDPPATLKLWNRILIYGVAFGTAKRMIDSGRIPAPVTESSQGTWSNYWYTGAITNSSFDASGFSSGFSSQVAPESSSGGGGFSGGGGGFSGGGGGGSW